MLASTVSTVTRYILVFIQERAYDELAVISGTDNTRPSTHQCLEIPTGVRTTEYEPTSRCFRQY
jgi:hypothetical protein